MNDDDEPKKTPGWQKRLDKTRLVLWRRLTPQFAAELLRDLYLGILGRELDDGGHAAYIGQANRLGDPVGVITDLIFSDEFKRRSMAILAPELTLALYQSILGRKPDDEGMERHAGTLAHDKSFENVASDLLASDEFKRRGLALLAPELTLALYHAILGREPDAEGLETGTGKLARDKNLEAAITDLLDSEEFKRRGVALLAPELTRALYHGILGRDPDAEGLERNSGKLAREKNVADLAADLLASDEFKRRTFADAAPTLARALHAGILGPATAPENAEALAARLTQPEDVEAAVAGLLATEEYQRKLFAGLAPELARAFYRATLGREPDEEGLKTLADKITGQENVEWAVADLLSSEEYQRQAVSRAAPQVAHLLYHALLVRDPDAEGLETLAAKLGQPETVAGAVNDLVASEEFRRRIFPVFAPEMTRAFYRAVLAREPDEDGLATHAARLTGPDRVGEVLDTLVGSGEFQRKAMLAQARAIHEKLFGREADEAALERGASLADLVHEWVESDEIQRRGFAAASPTLADGFYRGILGRDADPNGRETYTHTLSRKENFESALRDMIKSEEFRRAYTKPEPVPHPRLTYQQPCWLFLHIEKTAGTSIQNLLAATFPPKLLLREHDDTLYRRSPGELSQYTAFAGHFNHDSIAFIPRKKVSVLTFVREPISRLYSLYHFLRAHEPDHHSFGLPMKLANELAMPDFYRSEAIKKRPGHWNHMTWVVMGRRQWEEWKQRSVKLTDALFSEGFIGDVVRPAIRARLREFAFVGLQEEFDRSVDLLFQALKKPKVPPKEGDHSLETLMESSANFKRRIDKQPLTDEAREIMERLNQLDRVLYEEAKILFHEQADGQPEQTAVAAVAVAQEETMAVGEPAAALEVEETAAPASKPRKRRSKTR